MSDSPPDDGKSSMSGQKSKFENKSLFPEQFLSVEEGLSFLIRPAQLDTKSYGKPDEHLTGLYFHIVEEHFFRLPSGEIQIVDYGRIWARIKSCSFKPELKKKVRTACKKKDFRLLQLYGIVGHPHFKECFRVKIGSLLLSHFKSINSIHALYLAFAVSCTSKVLSVTLSHSYQCHRGVRQKDLFPFTMLFLYYQKQLKAVKEEKELIKKIKVSLCTEFSRQSGQDLPDGHERSFRIFPKSMRTYLDNLFENDQEKLVFYFSVQQSKSLCFEVSEEFVFESLLKHRKTLCEGETRRLAPEFRQELIRQGEELGRFIRNNYNPFRTKKAPLSASYSTPRSRDGVVGELIDKDMVFLTEGPLESDAYDRCEPLVIGLFGEPACGKSTFVQKLISDLQRELFPYVNLNNVSYSRSCSMKHWDGYKNQPIVVLDDFGQSSDRLDTIEFQQLISCNPYQLPMAELEEKGTMFNSPIVILTSNMDYGSSLSTQNTPSPVEDNLAFWRRIHLPVLMGQSRSFGGKRVQQSDLIVFTESLRSCFTEQELKEFKWIKDDPELRGTLSDPFCSSQFSTHDNRNTPVSRKRRKSVDSVDKFCWRNFPRWEIRKLVCRQALNFKEHFHRNTSKFWNQIVCAEHLVSETYESGISKNLPIPLCGSSKTVTYRFPRHPPKDILPVRVEPIKEPLKCRIITAGEAETRCLKPLQQTMWDYLGTKQQFKLTHGTKFLEKSVWNCRSLDIPDPKIQEGLDHLLKGEEESSEKVWVSGDYSAATDNFILECGSIILENALKYIDHQPTREWAMKEMSSHLLVYPNNSGIAPGIQRNGQLMGSLLSFPLLCLVNDSTAKLAGASSDQYLINGDDILMRVPPSIADKWKVLAPSLGLELSIGKTFFDPNFGTVNSQLFYEGKLLPTGKLKTLNRRTKVLGETFRDFMRFHRKDGKDEKQLVQLFLKLNRPNLLKTFESLRVPTSHGGLGLFSIEEESVPRKEQDLLVYLSKLLRKLKPRNGTLKFPYFGIKEAIPSSNLQSALDRSTETEYSEGVTSEEVRSSSKRIDKTPVLRTVRELIRSSELSLLDLPDLEFIQFKEMNYSKEDYRVTQESINNRFLNQLLDIDVIFSQDAKILLERFRALRENRILSSLGIIDSERTEVPYSSLLDYELVPKIMCPERLWSKFFNSEKTWSAISEPVLPEKKKFKQRSVPFGEISQEDFQHITDYSSEITQYDNDPTVILTVPDFEVDENHGIHSMTEPYIPTELGSTLE